MAFDPTKTHADIALSNSNRTLTMGGSTNAGKGGRTVLAATIPRYAEIKGIEWTTSPFCGIGLTSADYATQAGSWANSWVYYQQNGYKYIGDTSQGAFGSAFTANNDVIGIAYNPVTGKLWFAKQNTWQASGNPAADTNPAFSGLASGLYLFVTLYRKDSPIHVITGNFVTSDLVYSPPSGFSAWDDTETTLEVGNSSHTQAAETFALTQAHTLGVQSAAHLQSVDALILAQQQQLSIQASDHVQIAPELSLTQAHLLTVAPSQYTQNSSSPTLIQDHLIALQSATHVQSATELSLTQAHVLAVQIVESIQTASELTLTQAHQLAVESATHLQSATVIDLAQGLELSVQHSTHPQLASALDLVQAHLLTIQSSAHSHLASAVDLTQQITLIVSSSLHAQIAQHLRFVAGFVPSATALFIQAEDRLLFIQAEDRLLIISG